GIFDLANAPLVGSTNQLPLNQWAHLAATYDGTNGTIYINGNVAGYGPLPVAPPNVLRTNNYIGRSNFGGDGYANAIFDEVRIWNVARTASQIQTEMKRSLSGNEAGLVGYWRFDEGAGTIAVDATGAGHVATLVNSPTWQMSRAPLNPGLPSVSTLAASSV